MVIEPVRKRYKYAFDCRMAPDVDALQEMVDNAKQITYKTFIKHVSVHQLAEMFPMYERRKNQGLTLANDWSVSFYVSKYKGNRCYFLDWSRIEFVFMTINDFFDISG